jgi:DNA-binding MarR family transcriptional regulator
MTQIHVLRQLEQHGTMSMSRVAELLDVSLSNATGIIDRMAEHGLVERVRVPDDRRVVLVQPSALGIQALDETEGIKLDRIRAICNRLDDTQLRRITHAMGDLRVAIAAEFEMDSEEAHPIHQHSTSAG